VDITVDHKDGNGSNTKHKNNCLDNLQTLCSSCHGKKETIKRKHIAKEERREI